MGVLVILWVLQQRRVPKLWLSVLKIYWSTSDTTLKNQRSGKENFRNFRCYVMVNHRKFSSMFSPGGCFLDYAYKDLLIIGLHFCISLRKKLQKLKHRIQHHVLRHSKSPKNVYHLHHMVKIPQSLYHIRESQRPHSVSIHLQRSQKLFLIPLISYLEKKLSLSSHDESSTITSSFKRKSEAKPKPAENQKIISDVSEVTVREKWIYETFRNLTNLAVACFLKTIIPIFESTNKVLQSGKPLVHCLLSTFSDLFRKIMLCFVKPNLVKGASNLLDIAYDQRINQKEDQDLMVGSGTQCIFETLGKKSTLIFICWWETTL